jgi:hypothetical protein
MGTLGTAEIENTFEKISASPNPVYNSIAFDSETECNDCSVQIYDMIGRQLFIGPQLIPGELDLHWLSPGMYMYRFNKKGSYSKSRLFVKAGL